MALMTPDLRGLYNFSRLTKAARMYWQKKTAFMETARFSSPSIFGRTGSWVRRVRSSDKRSEVHQNYSYTLQ
jgi:hypothetical protein